MEVKPKIEIAQPCFVEFIPGQRIPAICAGYYIDIFERIYYHAELQLSPAGTPEEDRKTKLLEGLEPAYIFPV